MKRTALVGSFFLLVGLVSLILLASIFYSCRQGGHPHDMGTHNSGASHSTRTVPASPAVVDRTVPTRPPASSALYAVRTAERG